MRQSSRDRIRFGGVHTNSSEMMRWMRTTSFQTLLAHRSRFSSEISSAPRLEGRLKRGRRFGSGTMKDYGDGRAYLKRDRCRVLNKRPASSTRPCLILLTQRNHSSGAIPLDNGSFPKIAGIRLLPTSL